QQFLFSVAIDQGPIAHGETGNTINRVFMNSSSTVFSASDGTVSIEESVNESFQLFPNPSTEEVNVFGADSGSIIQLVDLTGKVVVSTNDRLINVSHLKPGLYLVKTEVRGAIRTEKILIQ
ncbi:MAG: T9SS type A sorting domain-containing protein, partial [Flavobacteriales bacterium]|nr:T9SS type A sorting domain-containing protein [Flavobacteriales bacterium]